MNKINKECIISISKSIHLSSFMTRDPEDFKLLKDQGFHLLSAYKAYNENSRYQRNQSSNCMDKIVGCA